MLTPPSAAGPLLGITRELTIEWGRASGIEIREESLPLEVLDSADEVFITSSTRDVLPIHAVDDRTMPAERPVTSELRRVFRSNAERNCDP